MPVRLRTAQPALPAENTGAAREGPKGTHSKPVASGFDGWNPSRPTSQRAVRKGRSLAFRAESTYLMVHSEQQLHDRDREPPLELAADLARDAGQLEPARRVERPRGVAGRLDPRHHRVE